MKAKPNQKGTAKPTAPDPKAPPKPTTNLLDNILDDLDKDAKRDNNPYAVPAHRHKRVYERIRAAFPTVKTEIIATEYQNKRLKEIIARTLKVDELEEYRGSVATIFSRKHFGVIQGGDYWICAVSGGMKFMFFVCEEGVYLVDKKFNFFKVVECSGMEMFSRAKGESSLLEGELVNDKKSKKVVFYFSDAIQINGEYCAHSIFTERLNLIMAKILSHQAKSTPFELNKKRFFSKSHIDHLLKDSIYQEPSGIWYYKDEKRCYRIQSILFKPNEPFPLLSTKQIFEKKLINSAHFCVRKRENHLYALSVASEYGESEFKEVAFREEEVKKLELLFVRWKGTPGKENTQAPVITCLYNPLKGEWNLIDFPKKLKASKAIFVMSLLLSVAEDVKKEELMYRVNKKTEEDDWFKLKKIKMEDW